MCENITREHFWQPYLAKQRRRYWKCREIQYKYTDDKRRLPSVAAGQTRPRSGGQNDSMLRLCQRTMFEQSLIIWTHQVFHITSSYKLSFLIPISFSLSHLQRWSTVECRKQKPWKSTQIFHMQFWHPCSVFSILVEYIWIDLSSRYSRRLHIFKYHRSLKSVQSIWKKGKPILHNQFQIDVVTSM